MPRIKRSEESWVALVEEFEQSKLSRRVFSEKHHIKPSTFQYWLYKVRRERQVPGNGSGHSAFLEVSLKGMQGTEAPQVRLELAGDLSVVFEALPEPEYIAALVKALA